MSEDQSIETSEAEAKPYVAPATPALTLETLTHYASGYGGPGQYSLRIVYGNALLEKMTFGNDYDMGRMAVALEQKWQFLIDTGTIDALAATKPRAFLLCTICGALCKTSGCSIGRPSCDPGEGPNHFLCGDCDVKETPRILAELEKDRAAGELRMQALCDETAKRFGFYKEPK